MGMLNWDVAEMKQKVVQIVALLINTKHLLARPNETAENCVRCFIFEMWMMLIEVKYSTSIFMFLYLQPTSYIYMLQCYIDVRVSHVDILWWS